MIFSNGLDDKVRDGSKTQTRRLVQETDELLVWNYHGLWEATTIYRNSRMLWETHQSGKTYAIQSGRGKKGNGRFRITKIRKDRLQDISIIDCYAEGTVEFIGHKPIDDTDEGSGSVSVRGHFGKMWNGIHKKSGTRWEDNPEVWVLEIENVGRVLEDGTYQHIFNKLDSPYKMMGQLISWASICGRAFAAKEPQPNTKKLKCSFCQDKENGHHGN